MRLGVGLVTVFAVLAVGLPWAVTSGRGPGGVLVGVAVSGGIATSVLLHEGAHAVAARKLGYRVEWVLLGAVAGRTSYSGPGDRPLDRAAIALAGPAASAAFLLALLALWAGGGGDGAEPVLAVVGFNAVTFVANLLPVPGSDGWYVVAGLTEDRRMSRRTVPPPVASGPGPPVASASSCEPFPDRAHHR